MAHERGAASALGFVTSAAFLRHTCHFTAGAARGRIDLGVQLREQPTVAKAFAEGAVSYAHAALVMKTLNALPDRLAAESLPVLVEAARILDTGRLAQVARRLRHLVDPDGQGSIDERHHEEQCLEVAQTFAGMFTINGLLDAESGAALMTALEAAMRPPAADDTRTAARRRADALVEVLHHALDHGDLPDVCGERPHLLLVSDLATLKREAGAPPAELVYGGPVGVETGRRLACDPIVTRVIVADSVAEGRGIMKSGWQGGEIPKCSMRCHHSSEAPANRSMSADPHAWRRPRFEERCSSAIAGVRSQVATARRTNSKLITSFIDSTAGRPRFGTWCSLMQTTSSVRSRKRLVDPAARRLLGDLRTAACPHRLAALTARES